MRRAAEAGYSPAVSPAVNWYSGASACSSTEGEPRALSQAQARRLVYAVRAGTCAEGSHARGGVREGAEHQGSVAIVKPGPLLIALDSSAPEEPRSPRPPRVDLAAGVTLTKHQRRWTIRASFLAGTMRERCNGADGPRDGTRFPRARKLASVSPAPYRTDETARPPRLPPLAASRPRSPGRARCRRGLPARCPGHTGAQHHGVDRPGHGRAARGVGARGTEQGVRGAGPAAVARGARARGAAAGARRAGGVTLQAGPREATGARG